MEAYLRKVVRLLSALGYDADTISRMIGLSIDTVKEFIPIV